MLIINDKLQIPLSEVDWTAVRSGGPGGQHVNKVSSAVHLRFNIRASSLPEIYKERLLNLRDRRMTLDGVLIIKAQQYRSQIKNKEEALERLRVFIARALVIPKKRKATRPSKGSKEKRLSEKKKHGRLKAQRKNIPDD